MTKSWVPHVAIRLESVKPAIPNERRGELRWLAVASLMVGCALLLAFSAKTRDFDEAEGALARGELVNLNAQPTPAQLGRFTDTDAVSRYLERAHPLANVGALGRVVHGVARVKPFFVVRTPAEYRRSFFLWAAIYFAGFYAVHVAWRWRRFRGDGSILPALHLLTGMGLTLAVSIRDPLRDTLEFSKFAWGVAGGCALLLIPLLRISDWRRYSRWLYTPLFAAFALFVLLLRFGSGPTGSDSKVNLGPFQPVEIVKILLVAFMAAYFARRWEWLREMRRRRRFAHSLPVMCAVACALLMFFVLKDLGPALVTGFLFLILFAVARGRAGLAAAGIVLVIAGVTAGYRLGQPHTVVDRISMWLSPWDNNVRGGDQVAHATWAMATGGATGSGPGYGDPGMIPAGHTDLVLPALAEEWGFAGVAAVALLFAFLFARCVQIGLRAADEHGMFLAFGFGTLVALEMLLISGGALGVVPLSGVASPFLSSGNTAMLANFFIFAVVLAISQHGCAPGVRLQFVRPVRWAGAALGVAALAITAKAAYIQVLHSGDLVARDTLVYQQDGVKRPQHNPRLNSLARELVRGTIYDRNGVVLAESRWDGRRYPYGPVTAHLLGDLTTGENFHATNSSLIEHDQNAKLQGFTDIRDLAPILRYRHHPGNAAMLALKARDRTVHASIDIRLQARAAEILARRLAKIGKQNGALVVMDARSGDVLALVSAPEVHDIDRARYGFYPPGSTFKLVTAIAALRLDPSLERKTFHCGPLGGGRVGTRIPGWNRPIRDDIGDSAHGSPDLARAIAVSCNAYFAQLGVNAVGAKALAETAALLDIPAGDARELQKMLPFAAYGQGPVLISPFKMARVAATIADGGAMPQGRWVLDDSNPRTDAPRPVVAAPQAQFVAAAMRAVVTSGTARRTMAGSPVSIAGKTGTAQMDEGAPHSWFAGFAPYDGPADRRISFAVVVEHGGYGAQAAAPIARELVEAAADLGIIPKSR